ncbi:MAG: phenylalanine--tRNA ligase subunit alpha [Pirellulales bacterium]|nr:phenylalanine--tRNA ligase subunit alpha [Pirellulales bacterium]
MTDEIVLSEGVVAVWQTLAREGPLETAALVERTGIDQAQIAATAIEGADKGFLKIVERPRQELVPTADAAKLLESGLPELRAAQHLAQAGGELPLPDFIQWAKENKIAPNEVLKWGPMRGWLNRVKGDRGASLVLTDQGRAGHEKPDDDLQALTLAIHNDSIFLDSLPEGIDPERVAQLLGKRSELAKLKKRTERILELTSAGHDALARVRVVKERNSLTPEDLESGAWREIQLRPYDVTLAAKDVFPAKVHPLRKVMEETRRAFLEMGFTEVASPMVESAFWNFDALFQPQDHPARDMQDTFYMSHPQAADLPNPTIVDQVKRAHEDGGDTGSEGWGYDWKPERSQQVVLRTHTTAATIRALSRNPNPPGKYFCVGWTFRNETISFKHLPVFHQVDGIVIDEEANLASLLGTLQEFYSKMGFGRVKFKPAFYPYTEPSVDVVVYMESRGKWIEMGGAGIFRPEVTQPLGCQYPVLAWGLGVERLAMLRCGFDDIRELYRSNLDSLEAVALCR